jgi:hypothetical protein
MADLREKGFGLTRLEGSGSSGSQVAVLLAIVPRSELDRLTAVLDGDYPDAIFTAGDIRSVRHDATIFYRERRGILSRWPGR